jgi:hypothetical protein
MSVAGVAFAACALLALASWIVVLARRRWLSIGYALAAFGLLVALGLIALIPDRLGVDAPLVPGVSLLTVRATCLIVLGVGFVLYVLVKITTLSRRLTVLVQQLAVREAVARQETLGVSHPQDKEAPEVETVPPDAATGTV